MTNNYIDSTINTTLNMINGDTAEVTSNGKIDVLGPYEAIDITNATSNSFILNNNIIRSSGPYTIYFFGSQFGTLTNNDLIDNTNVNGIFIEGNTTINNIINNNAGFIYGQSGSAIVLDNITNDTNTINNLTNFGKILSRTLGVSSINCIGDSKIINLNNLQKELTYKGNLPINYNIVINSISNYGSLEGTNSISGTLKFGIYPSSSLQSGMYLNVLTGLKNTNVDPTTRSGIFNTYYNWNLVLRDNNEEARIWDLFVNALNPACIEQVGGPNPPRLWSREEINCSVTMEYSQYQLDMRRKAEVLQYKANSAHLTKKQQWSQNVRGAGPNAKKVWANQNVYGSNPNVQNLPRVGNTLILPCVNNNGIICSPSNASDVPGPNIELCYNPNIPLINYKVRRTYLAGGTKFPQLGGGTKPL